MLTCENNNDSTEVTMGICLTRIAKTGIICDLSLLTVPDIHVYMALLLKMYNECMFRCKLLHCSFV